LKKGSTMTKSVSVRSSIRKAVKYAMRGPAQSIQIESSPRELYIFNKTILSQCNYFRVPVAQAIPGERVVRSGPDTRWRSGSKILIKGVNLRAKLHYSVPVEVMAALYPAKIQGKSEIPLDEYPATAFQCGTMQKGTPNGMRLLNLDETNTVNATMEGPFDITVRAKNNLVMNSSDRSLFGCHLSKGPGAPVGEVRWKKNEDYKVQERGKTYYQQFHPSGDSAAAVWQNTQTLQVYFDYRKEVKYISSSTHLLVFEPHFELIVGVRALSSTGVNVDPSSVEIFPVGMLESVVADVYYRMA
jgi:hypothetical protein